MDARRSPCLTRLCAPPRRSARQCRVLCLCLCPWLSTVIVVVSVGTRFNRAHMLAAGSMAPRRQQADKVMTGTRWIGISSSLRLRHATHHAAMLPCEVEPVKGGWHALPERLLASVGIYWHLNRSADQRLLSRHVLPLAVEIRPWYGIIWAEPSPPCCLLAGAPGRRCRAAAATGREGAAGMAIPCFA